MQDEQHENARARAEELFLAALAEDPPATVAELAARHPQLADALRALERKWSWLDRACEDEPAPNRPALIDALVESSERPRYVRREEIARGGMGVILRTRDEHLQRDVALKLSSGAPLVEGEPGNASRGLLRFLAEAQVMGQLDHPGVVPVHDLGIDPDGRPFFTMSLVEGEDLDQVLEQSGEWTLRRIVRVLVRVCETIEFAHAHGIVHRDLKPSNVRVGKHGQVYVMDWGLARVGRTDAQVQTTRGDAGLTDDALLTQDGAVLGTPAYMPPEQARGAVEDVTERADVYAIGAILYHALTGAPPYADDARGGASAILAAVLRAAPPAPRDLDPGAPRELAAICCRAMERDASARYASARELGEDLRAWLERRPVSAAPPGPLARLAKWILRNRTVAGGLALASIGLVAGLVWALRAENRRNSDLQAHNTVLSRARERADATADAARLSTAISALELGRIIEARASLNQVPKERRTWGWRHVATRLDRSVQRLAAPPKRSPWSLSLDPLGRFAAVLMRDKTLWISEGPGEDLVQVQAAQPAISVVVRPGERREVLLLRTDGAVVLRDLEDGRVVELLPPCGRANMGNLEVDPTGRRLFSYVVSGASRLLPDIEEPGAFVDLEQELRRASRACFDGERMYMVISNEIRTFDADDGELLDIFEAEPEALFTDVALSAERGWLVVGESKGELRILDRADFGELFRIPVQREPIETIALDPTGTLAAVHGYGTRVHAVDLTGATPALVGIGHDSMVRGVQWESDTGRLWSAGADRSLRSWSLHRPNAAWRLPIDYGGYLAASPDGARMIVASSGKGIYIVDSDDHTLIERLEDAPFAENSIAAGWTPDGRHVVAAYSGGSARVWETQTWRNVRTFDGGEVYGVGLALDPTGERCIVVTRDREGMYLTSIDFAGAQPMEPHKLPYRGIGPIEFDARGERLFVAEEKRARLFVLDAHTFEQLGEQELEAPAGCLARRPGTSLLSVGLFSGPILQVDMDTLEVRERLVGHAGKVNALAHDASGTLLMSGGDDYSARLWDLELVAPLVSLPSLEGRVMSVEVAPDRSWIISSQMRDVLRWSDEPHPVDWDRLARARREAPDLARDIMRAHDSFEDRLRALDALDLEPVLARAVRNSLVRARPMVNHFVESAARDLLGDDLDPESARLLMTRALDLRGRATEQERTLEAIAVYAARLLGEPAPAGISALVRSASDEDLAGWFTPPAER